MSEEMGNAEQSEGVVMRMIIPVILVLALLGVCARWGPSGVNVRECLANRDAKSVQGIPVGLEEQECPPPPLPEFPGF